MRRSLCLLAISAIVCFGSCGIQSKEDTAEQVSEESSEAIKTPIAVRMEASNNENLFDCIPINNEIRVQLYDVVIDTELEEETQVFPLLSRLEVCDSKTDESIFSTLLLEYEIPAIPGAYSVEPMEQGVSLYIRGCTSYYIFANDGELVKKIVVPNESEISSLSRDCTELVYLENTDDNPYGILVLLDIASGKKKNLYSLDFGPEDFITISDIWFSESGNRVGVFGQTIFDENESSADSYGYLNLRDQTKEVIVQEGKYVEMAGNNLIIYDQSMEIDQISSGEVLFWDLDSLEKRMFHTKEKNESQEVYPVNDSVFLTTLEETDENDQSTLIVRQYENGECKREFAYCFEDGNTFGMHVAYEECTKRFYLNLYDSRILNYAVETIS